MSLGTFGTLMPYIFASGRKIMPENRRLLDMIRKLDGARSHLRSLDMMVRAADRSVTVAEATLRDLQQEPHSEQDDTSVLAAESQYRKNIAALVRCLKRVSFALEV